MTLVITDWERHYESHESRKIKTLPWVKVPTKHDGLGYAKLIQSEDGMALFGAWILILQVAARTPRRGVLKDSDGHELSPDDISIMTRSDKTVMAKAVQKLQEIGWIKSV